MLSQPKRQSGALDSREPPLSMIAQSTILPNASAESWQKRTKGITQGANTHRFPSVPSQEPAIRSLKNAGLSVAWASRAVLDQVAARHRHMLDQRHRATLKKMPSRVLLVEGVLGRHAVDRHDHLEAALGGTLARARDRALRRGAGDDHGADALILE